MVLGTTFQKGDVEVGVHRTRCLIRHLKEGGILVVEAGDAGGQEEEEEEEEGDGVFDRLCFFHLCKMRR